LRAIKEAQFFVRELRCGLRPTRLRAQRTFRAADLSPFPPAGLIHLNAVCCQAEPNAAAGTVVRTATNRREKS
jgi:hypothetical protein